MKNRSIAIFLVLLAINLVLSCSSSSTVLVKVAPKSYDFGQVNVSYSANFDFVITNKKSIDISITTLTLNSNEFTETGSSSVGQTITAKGSYTITVKFSPAMPAGLKSDVLYIEWTDVNLKTGELEVKLSGEAVAVPKIEVTPTTFDFGVVFTGASDTANFDIENTGTADLVISLFTFNGNANYFSITTGGNTPVNIAPGTTLTITVKFEPTLGGTFPTTLEITHNAVNLAPPFAITIAAEGLVPIPLFGITPNPHNFGDVTVNASDSQNFTIDNTGNSDLNITTISFTGADAGDFAVSANNAPFIVTPGGSAVFTVDFTPSSLGAKSATMVIDHNAASSPDSITLSGAGKQGNGSNGYTKSDFPVGYTSIANTGRDVAPGVTYQDDGRYQINIGYSVWFFGRSYTTAWACTNSWLAFGADPGTNNYSNGVIPSTPQPNAAIYPFWDDTVYSQTTWPDAKFVYEVQGSAPNRIFVVEFYHFRHLGTSGSSKLTYQIRVYETTNVVELCYPATAPSNDWIPYSSDSASIGIENETGTVGNMVTSNTNQKPTSNYRFTPN